jgi:ABC-type multidrug transport system ATPase subunit/pSer/pThr/pTyr-binding forkhead associated (FHA) protein
MAAIRVSVEHIDALFSDSSAITIGRDPSCTVVVDHPLVSRTHAVVRSDPSGWVVEDVGSRNGLFDGASRVARLEVVGAVSLRLGDPTVGPELKLWASPAPAWTSRQPASPSPAVSADDSPAGHGDGHRPDGGPALGTLTGFHARNPTVRIGRDPANDIVVDDLLVSRHHAELNRRPDGRYELVDLHSHNGTFVDGRRVDRAALGEQSVVTVGHHLFRLTPGGFEEYVDRGATSFEASQLSVRSPDGKTLLDDVGFSLTDHSLLAVVGPSGAGKSTLLNALTGFRPAQRGAVLYNGRDLYDHYDELRGRIGLVPQDDIVHSALTCAQALCYAAELRFPADVGPAQRHQRVEQVLADLGLADRSDHRIANLSGGQRKRLSVALELLTEPSLLFLDEPTSGLDPGYERAVMRLLRRLADDGRTIIVVTHSVQSLDLCDRVLFMAPGGHVAYFGAPQLALAYFGRDDFQQVFEDLSSASVDWAARFRDRADGLGPISPQPVEPAAARHSPVAAAPRSQSWLRQLGTLTRRYTRVLVADRRNLAFLLLQAPVLGLLLLLSLPRGELAFTPPTEVRLVSNAPLVLFVLMLGTTWLGASNAAGEIAKELVILRRERAVGLSISTYVMSKALVLGVVSVLQAVVLTSIAVARQGGPTRAVALGWPLGELMFVVALAGIAAMALGLLVSAASRTVEQATTILPVLLIMQIVLTAGALFPALAQKPVLEQLSYASSAQWGLSAAASTVTLNELQKFSTLAQKVPIVHLDQPEPTLRVLAQGSSGRARWAHTSQAWWTSVAALTVLSGLFLAATMVTLRLHDPGVV